MTSAAPDIRTLALFSDLAPDQLRKVQAILRFYTLERREVLFRQGDPVLGMFFVLSGKLKLYKLSADGKEHILHVVGPGQGFAEAAVFMDGGYPAFAEALQNSHVVCMPKAEFLALLRADPDLSLRIIASLSRHLKRFADRIEDLSLKDVSARFARWLLQTAADKDRDFWELDITKGALASHLGTVGETLSRTLRKFKEAKVVQVRGRFMKILDRPALERIALGEESDMR
jgi:CRP/FNR family transcriptional regulator